VRRRASSPPRRQSRDEAERLHAPLDIDVAEHQLLAVDRDRRRVRRPQFRSSSGSKRLERQRHQRILELWPCARPGRSFTSWYFSITSDY
jgi:hypothetical protein